MVIDISFAFIFIAGVFILWYRISAKLPELIAIPDEVIASRLHEDSAKFRVFALRLKLAYEEKRVQVGLFKVLGKFLYRFHIVIMRLDNRVLAGLKKIRAKGYYTSNGNEVIPSDMIVAKVPRYQKVEEVRIKGN